MKHLDAVFLLPSSGSGSRSEKCVCVTAYVSGGGNKTVTPTGGRWKMQMREPTMSVECSLITDTTDIARNLTRLHLHLCGFFFLFFFSDSPQVKILPSSDLPREGERFTLQCLGNSNPE